jgi:hypothetical protein
MLFVTDVFDHEPGSTEMGQAERALKLPSDTLFTSNPAGCH